MHAQAKKIETFCKWAGLQINIDGKRKKILHRLGTYTSARFTTCSPGSRQMRKGACHHLETATS
eukprot:1176728-Prorocentrum_minimum.AAC.3